MMETGVRVSNTWVTCLFAANNSAKAKLKRDDVIYHKVYSERWGSSDLPQRDRPAPLACW